MDRISEGSLAIAMFENLKIGVIALFLDMYPPLGIFVVLLNGVNTLLTLLDLTQDSSCPKICERGSLEYGVSLGKCCPAAIGKHLPVG